MKHTPESLAGLSDFEVNKALALLVMLVLKKETWTFNNDRDTVQFFNEETKKSIVVDYCNNPSDVMPLVFEYGVSLIKMLSDWRACTNNGIYVVHSFDDKKPLRAAACCLILVLQE